MKQKMIIIFTLCLTAGIICGAMIKTDNRNEKNISDSEFSAVGYKYTLKEYKGNIPVFRFGSISPNEVLECPLKSLPDDEAQKLSAGINIKTEEELQRFIEAYD